MRPDAEAIPINFQRDPVKECVYLGEVVGSEGHWYNSWLLANADMTEAALNDLRNKAQDRGADTLYIPTMQHLFSTSVTFLGQAYHCRPGEPPPRRDTAVPPVTPAPAPDMHDAQRGLP